MIAQLVKMDFLLIHWVQSHWKERLPLPIFWAGKFHGLIIVMRSLKVGHFLSPSLLYRIHISKAYHVEANWDGFDQPVLSLL